METRAFAPLYGPADGTPTGGSLNASVTVSSIGAVTASTSAQLPGNRDNNSFYQIQIANKSTNAWAHVNFGVFGNVADATVAAGYPVAPGTVVVVSVNPEVSGASVIYDTDSTGGTASVIFTRGEGL